MIYDYLKILHILSASIVLGSIFYSYQLWLAMQRINNTFFLFTRIQKQTALIIIPATLIQLTTGFTMISLKHYPFTEWWISASLMGFILLITSWLAFVYFLTASQQSGSIKNQQTHTRHHFYRRAQIYMLLLCALSIAVMVFSMANRFTGPPSSI